MSNTVINIIIFLVIAIIVYVIRANRKANKERNIEILNEIDSFLNENNYSLNNWESIKESYLKGNNLSNTINLRNRIVATFEIEKAINDSSVTINNWDELKYKCLINTLDFISQTGAQINRMIDMYSKYKNVISDDLIDEIISRRTFLGMTEIMLRDVKGAPNKIDEQILKTKTKRIYIYGNKLSGDVFTFENGSLTKIVDRG